MMFFLIVTPAYAFSSYAQFTLPKLVTGLLQSIEVWTLGTDVNDVIVKMQAW